MSDPIVVIGAGIGGLSAAIRLAAAGERVVVLERNPVVGGKMAQVQAGGFRWDTGPSVITMVHVLEDLFACAGRALADYLTLLPVEPLTRYFYPDGTQVDASRDLAFMARQIAQIDGRDVEGYLAFLAYAAQLHRITGPVFIYDHPPTWRSFLRVSPRDALRVDAWRTMASRIERSVYSSHMRQLLGRFATYAGSSPYLASSTLSVIAHVELTQGVWYPQGGVYSIARALEQVARELGVDIRTGGNVAGLQLSTAYSARSSRRRHLLPRVGGVLLENGQEVVARAVIANLDVASAYHQLLPGIASPRRLHRLSTIDPSCSGMVLLLGIEGQHHQLAHHNIFFSGNYRQEFDDIFHRQVPPEDPTIYVAITSKTDPEHAPDGCENWFVLVNVPALATDASSGRQGRQTFDWLQDAQGYQERVLGRLASFGLDVRGRIRSQQMLTPLDLQMQTAAWRGALYGLSLNSPLAPFRRPHNRAPDVEGLYFAGGTTHPGGGVPMVMLSAKVAVEMMREDGVIG